MELIVPGHVSEDDLRGIGAVLPIAERLSPQPQFSVSRRGILAGGVALGVGSSARSALASREFLIRGGQVLTMAVDTPGPVEHDIHVRDGRIAAIGPGLDAPSATMVDARGSVVMPGLVDTHWHMWTSLLRNFAANGSDGYFALTGRLGRRFEPRDMRLAAMLAAADAIDHGITTVHDWCHNVRSPAHARGALMGLRDSGLRARFSSGATRETPIGQPLDAGDFARLHDGWDEFSSDGRLTLGIGWRGVMAAVDDRPVPVPGAAWRADLALARDRGLPISVHANNSAANSGHVRALAREKLLGGDMQIVHAVNAEPDEIAAIAQAGASVSLAPSSELTIGFGVPPVAALRAAGVAISASIDTPALVGTGDLLRELRLIHGLANAQAGSETAMTPMDALAVGTRAGAAALGLDKFAGTLAPGQRADLVIIALDAMSLQPRGDLAATILRSVGPADIKLVMVDGTILKQDGRLTRIDVTALVREVADASARIARHGR